MSTCLIHCRQEFQWKQFGFEGVHPGRFTLFQLRTPPWFYLSYRILLALYVDFWLFYTAERQIAFTGETALYSWPVYLTNWTYFMLALYLTWHAIGTLIFICTRPMPLFRTPPLEYHRNMFMELQTIPSLWGGNGLEYEGIPDEEEQVIVRNHQLPWYFKLVWILYSIVSTAAVMVTAVFFIFLWPQFSDKIGLGVDNIQLHLLNSVIIVIEQFVSAVPIRLYHYIYPLLYGLTYMIFSIIFWAVDHSHVIYPEVLDWNKAGPTVAMIAVLAFVVLPILHVLYFALYKIKICIYRLVSADNESI